MFLRKIVSIAAFAAVLAGVGFAGSAKAHHGNATGKCVDNVGSLTANFVAFGQNEPLLGNIVVTVNGVKVDEFRASGDFSRTYKPYANGTYTVKADWVMDWDRNGKVDSGESFGYTNTVKIEKCDKPVEKCPIPGKTDLPKNDPNCKEDPKCPITGKTDLRKDDPSCKEDEKKCTVPGKTHLPVGDPKCKEDPKEIPNTGFGTMTTALLGVAAISAAAHNLVARRR